MPRPVPCPPPSHRRKARPSSASPNFKLLEQLMGSMNGAKPFVRDRRDRI
ncbi:MAG: hypothetical protein V1708_01765 [Candidatus Micrarchaeota archaeon]